MATTEIRNHWQDLRNLGCLVTGDTNDVTIHHCHSGSMAEIGVNRGGGQKVSDWLTIPLRADLHVGRWGCDYGVPMPEWEMSFGRQVDLLDRVCILTGRNVWKLAGFDREVRGL